jgi:hypothetical protein
MWKGGEEKGQVFHPSQLAQEAFVNVYLVEYGNNRIQKLHRVEH